MPCDSSVVSTNMTDALRLRQALEADGWTINQYSSDMAVYAQKNGLGIGFSRGREGEAFRTNETNGRLAIQRKYSEIGVRAWAKKSGFSVAGVVQEGVGSKFTLVNQRS